MFEVGFETAEWAKNSKLHLIYEKSISSTNDLAKDVAFSVETTKHPMSLIVCDHQTQGRGRGQNLWMDPKSGTTLLCSWIFQLSKAPKPVTTCRIGMAVEKSLIATWPWLHFSLKAPNDIYISSKKVGGLLIENLEQGHQNRMIIGLGLNIWDFPENLNATSIAAHLKSPQKLARQDWNSFLDRLLLELSLAVSRSHENLSANEQRTLLYFLNQKTDLETKYTSVDADGTLHLPSQKIHWTEL